MMNLFTNKKKKKEREKLKIPKSVQDTIPYYAAYPDDCAYGVIETKKGTFTRSYLFQDVNFGTLKAREQEDMFAGWGRFLNSFDSDISFQVTINNRNIDKNEFKKKVLLNPKNDRFDELRTEYNGILTSKLREGRNNRKKEKYLTVSIEAESIDEALNTFSRIDTDIKTCLKKIDSSGTRLLSTMERLEILYDIYNIGSEGRFLSKLNIPDGGGGYEEAEFFDLKSIARQGLTTKDIIGPDSFEFKYDYFMIGNTYARALYMKNMPSFMKADFLANITETGCNMITSVNMKSISNDEAVKMIKRQILNINANMVTRQKSASKAGYSIDLVSPELKNAQEEALALQSDITNKDQKLFTMNMILVHFADSLDRLNNDTKTIQSKGNGALFDIRPVVYMQELGFDSALPLAYNRLKIERTLTTEAMAAFVPFSALDIVQENGMYYGLNDVSKNLILFNRLNGKNGNGFILGKPGGGKSMAAKFEMLNVLLNTNADVIVIDPESEYHKMAELLGGETVRIAIDADVYINPFDIDMNEESGEKGPLGIKSDFIISMCETICSDRYGLSPAQRSLIDKCVNRIYRDYINSYDPKKKTYDKSKLPTLIDFQEYIEEQPGYEAKQLADSLEMYTRGSLDIFAHKTNVKYNNRFVVYDIKDIGTNLKAMGLLIVLNSIWDRVVENRKKGKATYFYVDEVYLLFKNDTSAEFLRNFYKRARKYDGIPTSITQNVGDILDSEIAKTMIKNSDFVQMLNQSGPDKAELAELLGISDTQLEYITNALPGQGLIYMSDTIIPFENMLPKDSKIYKAMTTKLSEVTNADA